MPKSLRIRTKVGVDRQVNLNLEQDFEFIEILSLKLSQSEIYTRQCADYGVVAGRVSVNDGFGVPNSKVSIFIPITAEDETNPIISSIYPYKTIGDVNEDGYKYNLLPYKPSYPGHSATGSFPDLEDVLTNPTAIEIYDKYYKFTVTTNDSGDFMIFGVPTGTYDIIMNVDVSDIGPFSQSPQDLIRLGIATESQVNGTRFKSSENLGTLPQIISLNKSVTILPLWGDPELCQISITRTDFDLTAEANIEIKPTAVFMGSIYSDTDELAQKRNCKPKLKGGYQCSLFAGPGQILAIRQTIRQDIFGRPLLEEYEFENNGIVIDENGAWLLDVPMNLDYVVTNEFGEQVFSTDEKKGVPTRARYRFKVSWVQSPSLSEPVKRANFLVPNIKEHGWNSGIDDDPLVELNSSSPSYIAAQRSYAFSLNWDDYGIDGDVIQDAIDGKDMFYEMTYNKVYTVSQLLTGYRQGSFNNRYLAIKNITDDTCESTTNKFPTNETQFRFDLLFILFTIVVTFISAILKFVTVVFHIICFLVTKIRDIEVCLLGACISPFRNWAVLTEIEQQFSNLNVPLFTYPDCELCSCSSTNNPASQVTFPVGSLTSVPPFTNDSTLANFINSRAYDYETDDDANDLTQTIQNTLAGYQTTNNIIGWSFRTSNLEDFSYDLNGDGTNIAILTYYSNAIPLHERITGFNFKSKFFGNNSFKLTTTGSGNSPLNTNNQYVPHTIGGGHTQIKVVFNSDINTTPNLGLDTQLGGSLNISNNPNLGFHYDNIMIIPTENRYEDGTILTFNNPYNFDDPNMSGNTRNIYGTFSITGTALNTGVTTVNVSHTNPYTGERLVTPYNIIQTNGEADNYLRYPTNQEYFQVIKSLTYSEYMTILNNNYTQQEYDASYWGSFNQRIFENFENIGRLYFSRLAFECSVPGVTWTGPGFTPYAPFADGVNPWQSFNEKTETYFNIIVRGVDPHSSRVKVKYGLGKLFNRKSHWAVTFEGDYKLNIPLQPNDGLDFGQTPLGMSQQYAREYANRCVKHDSISGNNNSGIDNGYSKGRLYYKSFHFKPSQTDWTSFRTRTVYKYSSLSETDINDTLLPYRKFRNGEPRIRISNCSITNVNAYTRVGSPANGGGLRVDINNFYTRENNFEYPFTTPEFEAGKAFDNGKYALGECVEGGSVMLKGGDDWVCPTCDFATRLNSYYYSKVYSDPVNDNDCFLMNNYERIVMRSDRVPASDSYESYANPTITATTVVTVSHTLMANGLFYLTEISDEGVTTAASTSLVTPGFNVTGTDTPVPGSTDPESFGQVDALLASFSCQSLVPIECYQTSFPDSIYIKPATQCQYYSGTNEKFFIDGSCYSLVHPSYLGSNLTKDLKLITEWRSRININFGACREVFSHIFMNNWINGGLYMFPFKSQRIFTGPTGNPPNQPYNKYCRDTVYLEPETFNFYYRSSPWDGNEFIGRKGYSFNGNTIGNQREYMFPTTIMDLGPRDELQKYLSQSGNWDGYIVNRLLPTTFSDISDILNLFILSRFASANFGALFSINSGVNILKFFSRKALFVDSDYAQMVATNSQFGVAAFEPANYPEPPVNSGYNSPLYFPFGVDDIKDITFGIFFTGDSQVRDYISPNRTIYNPFGEIGVNEACALTYIPITTQEVPFYLWEIRANNGNSNIFGTQLNNWYSNSDAFKYQYQKVDRFLQTSKTFQPTNTNVINYHKGWIANYNPSVINPATQEYDYKPEPGIPDKYLMGAPFYFYFGVVKGSSAFDRFATKWIDTDAIAD